jgi:DNA-directed RNA polymerase specialized sigma24 family protein
MDAQDEIVRLLAIQVRSQFENQADAIRELARAGFGPTRIAELLGTTAGTVNVALARAKRAPKKPTTPKGAAKA